MDFKQYVFYSKYGLFLIFYLKNELLIKIFLLYDFALKRYFYWVNWHFSPHCF